MNAAFVQDTARNSERERDDRGKSRGTRVQGKGFRLSSANNTESEDSSREIVQEFSSKSAPDWCVVDLADVDLCPKKSRTSVAKIGNA